MQEWDRQEADRLAAHIERTTGRCELLRDRYFSILAMAGGETVEASRGRDEAVRSTSPAGRSLVNLDALDLAGDIEQAVIRLDPLALGALRLGMSKGRGKKRRDTWTAEKIVWLGTVLASIYAEDPTLGADVSDTIWQLDRKAARLLGEVARAFPLVEACAECDTPSLWAAPELLEVRCGNPGCRARWKISGPVPVYST